MARVAERVREVGRRVTQLADMMGIHVPACVQTNTDNNIMSNVPLRGVHTMVKMTAQMTARLFIPAAFAGRLKPHCKYSHSTPAGYS